MARYLPPLNPLRSFEAAARHMSFMQASDELNVTAGAISRQVKALEQHLGVTLFHRHHRRVELTGEGRAYMAELGDAFDRIAAASERVTAHNRRAVLALCAYPTFAIRWLIPRWGRFYDRHPEIDLQLTTSLQAVDFARDNFDAAICVDVDDWPGIENYLLVPVDTFPVCSPSLLQGSHPLRQPADLAHHTLLHSAPRPDDWRRWLTAAGVDAVDPDPGPSFESLNLAFQAAIEGIGVAIGIGALVADDLAQGRLMKPFGYMRRTRRPFHLVYPEAQADSPKLVALRDWLLEEADAVPQR